MRGDPLDRYKGIPVLVTGGAGAIGSNLVRALAEVGAAPVVALDDLSSSYEWNLPDYPNLLFVKGDIRDDGTIDIAISEPGSDRVWLIEPEAIFGD